MATIKQFEDLICWQKARLLTKEIYKIFKNIKYKDFGLQDQMQRAAVSVMSNIAEGFERGTKAEFINYLYIAKGSAGEIRCQLYVAFDAGYLNLEMFRYLNGLVQECSRLIESFVQKVKGQGRPGLQYKHLVDNSLTKWMEEETAKAGLVKMPDGSYRKKNQFS